MTLDLDGNQRLGTAEQNALEFPSDHHDGPAGLPVPNPTKSFWIDSPNANPLATEGSEGELTADADVCIIGSGVTGVSAAYHLSKIRARLFKAVILEARDFCSGATGRNGGHLTPNPFLGFRKRCTEYGTDEAIRSLAIERHTVSAFLEILESEELADAVDLVEGGHLTMTLTERNFRDAQDDYHAAKTAGADLHRVEWLSKGDMIQRYGTRYPGIRYPGHNVWPLKLVTQLYRLAKTNSSFLLHTHTPVTSIEHITPSQADTSDACRRWAVTTPRGLLTCDYIIHATNAYTSHLLPHMQGLKGIIPTRGQVIALRADATLDSLTRSGWSANEGFEYWFPRPVPNPTTDRPLVILGGGREASRTPFEFHVEDDSVLNEDIGRVLRNFLPSIFPGKYKVDNEPEFEWTGIMGYTKTGDPFVGPVVDISQPNRCYEGQYIAAGYSGHGMPRAFACAEVVAQMMIAHHLGQVWNIPPWIPRHYLTTAKDDLSDAGGCLIDMQ